MDVVTLKMDSATREKTQTEKVRHLPGEEGIWMFMTVDMIVFALFFGIFLYYRSQDVETFLHSQGTLNQNFAIINTLILLTSSWFVALALQAVRKKSGELSGRLFSFALMCGLMFIIIKVVEWAEKIQHGIIFTTNYFYMFYYVYTGIHFLHVCAGVLVLAVLWFKSRKTDFSDKDIRFFEGGAAYWHMVDLLWIVLFPLFYLMR